MGKRSDNTTIIAMLVAGAISIGGIGAALYALTLETSEHEAMAVTATQKQEETSNGHAHHNENKTAATPSAEQASIVIVYAANGFEKQSYTVKTGEAVLVENKSDQEFYFTTGDHHNHDINSPLNLGTIAPGKSSSFVAPAAGTYGFHNHDNETEAGELIVQ